MDLTSILIGVAVVVPILVLAIHFRTRSQPRAVGGGSTWRRAGRRAPEIAAPDAIKQPQSDYSLDYQVGTLLAEGRKIEAIKHVRDRTGCDVKQAKRYVAALSRRQG